MRKLTGILLLMYCMVLTCCTSEKKDVAREGKTGTPVQTKGIYIALNPHVVHSPDDSTKDHKTIEVIRFFEDGHGSTIPEVTTTSGLSGERVKFYNGWVASGFAKKNPHLKKHMHFHYKKYSEDSIYFEQRTPDHIKYYYGKVTADSIKVRYNMVSIYGDAIGHKQFKTLDFKFYPAE